MPRSKVNTNDEEKEEPVKKTRTTRKKPVKEETSVEQDKEILYDIKEDNKIKELEDTMRSVVKFNISVAIVLCLAMFILGFLLSHRISKLENANTNNTNIEESVQPDNSEEDESDNNEEEIDDSETDTSEEDSESEDEIDEPLEDN